MPNDVLLSVNNLTTEFNVAGSSKKAVDNISFSLNKGETVGIVGESGSGKSITSLSALKLLPGANGIITSGEILYYEKDGSIVDFVDRNEKEMQKYRGNEIAMIFQEPMTAMNPVMKCGEQVTEAILLHQKDLTQQNVISLFTERVFLLLLNFVKPIIYYLLLIAILPLKGLFLLISKAILKTRKIFLVFHSLHIKVLIIKKKSLSKREREAKMRALQLFKKVKLPRPLDLFDSYPHEISGGQKQRVLIAMALSCNPSILIADEPTTALDVTVQKTIIELLKEIQQEFNMGIIFISHDLGLVAEFADQILVMYKGKIVERGEVAEVYNHPKHPYTRGLLACRPPLNVKLRELPTRKHFLERDKDGFLGDVNFSVKDVINKLKTSPEEIALRNNILYKQDPLIQVTNLSKHFPIKKNLFGKPVDYVKAVDNVSLKVYPGETLGLVGESGCGKTTLGRAILKLIDASSGEIMFNDKNITNYTSKKMRPLRKDMQIIFQDPYSSLNPKIYIGEAIMEPMRVHSVYDNDLQRKQEVLSLLFKVGIQEDSFYRYPHEFSGGQRQRICIARALALQPKFILCDESVSALDVSVQAEVLNLLNSLRDEFGLTYIFISHDLSVVKFMSDRILVMKDGKIIEEGIGEEIYANPKNKYTKKLISSIPKGIVA